MSVFRCAQTLNPEILCLMSPNSRALAGVADLEFASGPYSVTPPVLSRGRKGEGKGNGRGMRARELPSSCTDYRAWWIKGKRPPGDLGQIANGGRSSGRTRASINGVNGRGKFSVNGVSGGEGLGDSNTANGNSALPGGKVVDGVDRVNGRNSLNDGAEGPHINGGALTEVEAGGVKSRLCFMTLAQEYLAQRGPFDGILGFSQGATLAALLCTQEATRLLQWKPRFALLSGGYASDIEKGMHISLLSSGICPDIDSVHLFGTGDQIVAPNKSIQLADLFSDNAADHTHCGSGRKLVLPFEGGHVFPTTPDVIHTIREFLVEEAEVDTVRNFVA